MTGLFSIAAVAIAAVLCWNLFRRFGTDRITAINEGRRAASRVVGRGEFIDGSRNLDVALALSGDTLYYENGEMEASLDLNWIREVEYDTRLATGRTIAGGKVLRLRSDSQAFEFVLPGDAVNAWSSALPPRGGAPGPQQAAAAASAAP